MHKDVIVVGAGISGIAGWIHLKKVVVINLLLF